MALLLAFMGITLVFSYGTVALFIYVATCNKKKQDVLK